MSSIVFFFQAEDGIRDLVRSRGLGDVYKRQPENSASLKIHEELGFRKIGIREKIGKMNGMWRDAILLERRSKVIGID